MRMLVSVRSVEEALVAARGGADFIRSPGDLTPLAAQLHQLEVPA